MNCQGRGRNEAYQLLRYSNTKNWTELKSYASGASTVLNPMKRAENLIKSFYMLLNRMPPSNRILQSCCKALKVWNHFETFFWQFWGIRVQESPRKDGGTRKGKWKRCRIEHFSNRKTKQHNQTKPWKRNIPPWWSEYVDMWFVFCSFVFWQIDWRVVRFLRV